MEKRQKAERFTILDPARVPEKPAKPNRPVFYPVSVLAALIVGIASGCAREWKKNVILGEWELPSGVEVLGRIPPVKVQSAGPMGPAGWAAVKLSWAASWIGSKV
jgi:hypothetical protein